jgi:hypothetical protein
MSAIEPHVDSLLLEHLAQEMEALKALLTEFAEVPAGAPEPIR